MTARETIISENREMNKIDSSFQPPIDKCLKYWYEGMHNLPPELAECRVGSQPFLQCMFNRPKFCKGRMLVKLTDSSPTLIAPAEREVLWYAAFGKERVFQENEKRTVNAGFLQWLLTNPRAVSLISTKGIHVTGIEIKGDLDLENVTINFPVVLEKCFFHGSINLTDAKMRSLSLKGSTCKGSTCKGSTCKGSTCYDAIRAMRIKIRGNLDLNERFRARGEVNIDEANISGNLNCNGGLFVNPTKKALTLDRAEIGGGVFLNNGFKARGEVSLKGVKIAGSLDCRGGYFKNSSSNSPPGQNEVYVLNTSLAEVNGKVLLSVYTDPVSKKSTPFRAKGHIMAIGMKVRVDFDCTEGRIKNSVGTCHAISIDRSIIGGSVFLRNGFSAHGQVRMFGIKIGDDLDCSGGEFCRTSTKESAALEARGAKIDGSVYLCGSKCSLYTGEPEKSFTTDGLIDLDFVNIGNEMTVGLSEWGSKTAEFKAGGGVNIKNSKITGPLHWKEVKPTEDTKLLLDNATVGQLITSGKESWPKILSLKGFVYNDISHGSDDDLNTHLDWLDRQKKPDPPQVYEFNPQIYEQLATVLSRSGQDDDALEVLINGEDKRREINLERCQKKQRSNLENFQKKQRRKIRNWFSNITRKIWNWLFKKTVAYGYKPLGILKLSLGIIIVSAILFHEGYKCQLIVPAEKGVLESKEYKNLHELPQYYPQFNAVIYSLDVFFPIGKLNEQEKWQPYDEGECSDFGNILGSKFGSILRGWSWVEAGLGWVCATLGIAGFTGLIRKIKLG